MEIILSKNAGFCPGVRRADDAVRALMSKRNNGDKICTLGSLIHNRLYVDELKKQGVWIFGTAAEGSIPMYQADLKGPAAIVIGSEGDGMSRLVRQSCDVTVHIPMKGKITSLNASNAASILLYEAVRQRQG